MWVIFNHMLFLALIESAVRLMKGRLQSNWTPCQCRWPWVTCVTYTHRILCTIYTPYSWSQWSARDSPCPGERPFLIPTELNNSQQIDSSVADGCSEAGQLPTQMQSQCIYQAHREYNDLAKQDIQPARCIVLMGWVSISIILEAFLTMCKIFVGWAGSSASCVSRWSQTF